MSDPPRADDLVPDGAAAEIARRLGLGAGHASLVPTSRADRPNGTVAEATLSVGAADHRLVIKRLPQGIHEVAAYRCLHAAGAPVATLVADFVLDGRETLVLERLPRIGHDASEAEFSSVIAALARLNAVAPAALAAPAPGWLHAHLAFWRRSAELSLAGDWGPALNEAARPLMGAWEDLARLAEAIETELDALPLAATHHDPCVGNCGWTAAGEIRFIDLSYATRHPLLADLAIKLGGSADPWPSSRGRDPWLALYGEHYARAGGRAMPLAQLRRGLALQHAALVMWMDSSTFARSDAALRASRPTDSAPGWQWHKARAFRRLCAMRAAGIDGAGIA